MITILKPKPSARFIAKVLVSLFFVKKVTVIGNIGKTQGVSTATKPPIRANIKNANKLVSDFVGIVLFVSTAVSVFVSTARVVSILMASFLTVTEAKSESVFVVFTRKFNSSSNNTHIPVT